MSEQEDGYLKLNLKYAGNMQNLEKHFKQNQLRIKPSNKVELNTKTSYDIIDSQA